MKKLLSLLLSAVLTVSAVSGAVFADGEETVSAPSTVISQAKSQTAISLSWNMSKVSTQESAGLGIKEYQVYEVNGEETELVKTVEKTEVTRPGCVISGLEPGSSHTYKVKAVSDNNVESGFSEEATFETLAKGTSADVALGKPVRTNSSGTDGFRGPEAAVNGMENYTLRSNVWRSKKDTEDKYLSVDLGEAYRLSHFVIKDAKKSDAGFNNCENIIIQGSNDGGDYNGTTDKWVTIAHSYDRNNENMFTEEKILTATTAEYRFIRVYFPSEGKETQVNLTEFEAYCAPKDEVDAQPAQPYVPQDIFVQGTAAYILITGGAKTGDDDVYTVFIGEGENGAISTVADSVYCTAAIDSQYGNASAHAAITGLKPGKTYRVQVQLFDKSRTQYSLRSNPRTFTVPTESGVNVALGRTAFTDKENNTRPVKCITDGNQLASTGIPYHYINYLDANKDGYAGVDLGAKRGFEKTVVAWPAAKKADGYKIQASNDYAEWKDIASETDALKNTDGTVHTISFANVQEYRYVRVYFPAADAWREIRLGEIEVYSANEVLTEIEAKCDDIIVGGTAKINVSGKTESGREPQMNEAIITFAADKEGIVSIKDNVLTGLKSGTVNITVNAKLYDTEKTITIPVKVKNDPSKFWAGDITFADQSGSAITAIDENTAVVTAKAEFNPDAENKTFVLLLGLYKNNVLCGTLKSECDLSAAQTFSQNELSVKVDLAKYGLNKEGSMIKAFLINSVDLLKPYSDAGKIEY